MISIESNTTTATFPPKIYERPSPIASATDDPSTRGEPLVREHPSYAADPVIEVKHPDRLIAVMLGAGSFSVLAAAALLMLAVS